MALPLIVFAVLLIIAIVVCYLGLKAETVFGGALLLSLGGVLFMSLGLLLFSSGLQLDNTNTITTTSPGVYTIEYQVITTQADKGLETIANVLLYGGILPIIASIALSILHFTKAYESKKDEWRI